ncbi:hypothetical protein PACTADRAFT_50883 [Pachysolen tannophilus NRRL Y-2460]|uniref:Meiosis protein 5 n=1 Tax=Pachysolen tannophilus NRRL Y-2460 TaxID=669874 RepID=A0A1E4TTK9_PACTA|nr:hypothetical protein PACTADRAFT_50883 [Pachysolen tannophilus NRRL Y-2460]
MSSTDIPDKENLSNKEDTKSISHNDLRTPAQMIRREESINLVTPSKSPNITKLPPLPQGSSIVLPKRRKISETGPQEPTSLSSSSSPSGKASNQNNSSSFTPLIPIKSRNFTTPLPHRVRRIPSLNDTPIPDLTPPTSTSINASLSFTESSPAKAEFGSSPLVSRNFSSPYPPLKRNQSDSSPMKNQSMQAKTSAGNESGETQKSLIGDFRREENNLDRETREIRHKIETIKQFKTIRDKQKIQELEERIAKWRHISSSAAAYLINEVKLKISRSGGWAEFKRAQSKKNKSQFYDETILDNLKNYKESIEYTQLDKYEQEAIDEKLAEEEKKYEDFYNDDDIDKDAKFEVEEFANEEDEMKEILKIFGIDEEKFNLIYNNTD